MQIFKIKNTLPHIVAHIKDPFLSPPPPAWFHLDVEQEPAGPQVFLMSMSLTTEPSNDGATVTEGLISHSFMTCPCAVKVCVHEC